MFTRDYTLLYEESGQKVGLSELLGLRLEQEDALAVGVKAVALFPELSVNTRTAVLAETFAQLQKNFTFTFAGSTACVTTAWIDNSNTLEIHTANLGDSAAYLILIDENTNKVEVRLLNKLHNPDPQINSEEDARIRAIKLPYKKDNIWRLKSGLAVSRSFGDYRHKHAGLIHTPEITHEKIELNANQKAFIVVACDGLTESVLYKTQEGNPAAKPALSLYEIASIINTHRKEESLEQIAELLATKAYKNGSEDNISVALTEVTSTPVSLSVFDGHAGDYVSRYLGKNFFNVYQKNIMNFFQKPKLIEDMRTATEKFIQEVTTDIIKTILNKKASRKLLVNELGLDASLSKATLRALILEQYTANLQTFIEEKLTAKTSTVEKLQNLLYQRTYGIKLQEALQDKDPQVCVDNARALFKDAQTRQKLAKGHGFWGWILQKLGYTKGQKLLGLFDKNSKQVAALTDLEKQHTQTNEIKPPSKAVTFQ